jgi:hypothetical protein
MLFKKFFGKRQTTNSRPQPQMPVWVNALPYVVPLLNPVLQEPVLHLWRAMQPQQSPSQAEQPGFRSGTQQPSAQPQHGPTQPEQPPIQHEQPPIQHEQPPIQHKQPPPRPQQPQTQPQNPTTQQPQPQQNIIFVTVTFFFSIFIFLLVTFFTRIKIVEETHITFLGIKIKI